MNTKHLLLTVLALTPLTGCVGQAAPNPAAAQAVANESTLTHWRFEETKPGERVQLAAAGTANRPTATADVPFASVPCTSDANTAAAEFRGYDNLMTDNAKINTFNFGPNGSNAWTVEFSVKMRAADGVNRLLGRDGGAPGEPRGTLQFVTVAAGGAETFDIRVEIVDGSGTFRDVVSQPIYRLGRWYNVAATANADTLRLYVDGLDGKGYQLVGEKPINGALSPATGPFAIGRGWNDGAADWMNGRLDEVRVSGVALAPEQFLFATADGGGVVAPPPIAEPEAPPLKLFYGADPHVGFFDGQYWMYITGDILGPKNAVFNAYSSPDRKTWTKHGPILEFKDVPWIYADEGPRYPWAPALAEKDGKYFFYYSVGPQGQVPARIGVAVSDSPAGPFRDKGEALLSGGNGFEAIDAMVFTDPVSKKSYFYAGGSAGAKLRVFELTPDMMSFVREIPVETPPQFTEGAFMHYHNGVYYLSYSHGYWKGPSYSVHYATSETPYGPWRYRGPILISDETRKGPGHHSFVQDPESGEWYIVYHRWQSPNGGDPFRARGRSIAITPMQHGPDGDILPITMSDTDLPELQE